MNWAGDTKNLRKDNCQNKKGERALFLNYLKHRRDEKSKRNNAGRGEQNINLNDATRVLDWEKKHWVDGRNL